MGEGGHFVWGVVSEEVALDDLQSSLSGRGETDEISMTPARARRWSESQRLLKCWVGTQPKMTCSVVYRNWVLDRSRKLASSSATTVW